MDKMKVAYKVVAINQRGQFVSPWYHGKNIKKVVYTPGKWVKNPKKMNTDRREDCGSGLHLMYAGMRWLSGKSEDYFEDGEHAVLKVKYHPKDAIIPNDAYYKFRVSKCFVVGRVKVMWNHTTDRWNTRA